MDVFITHNVFIHSILNKNKSIYIHVFLQADIFPYISGNMLISSIVSTIVNAKFSGK